MLSFVIGLNINENRVTATLVRIDESNNENLIIERDLFYIRLFPLNIKKDPYIIISVCIECIDDLLCDFINYYQIEDKILGIACAINNSMNNEQMNRFFGINLRLLFQSVLRNLIQQRKHHHYPKYFTPPTSPRATLSYINPQIHKIKSDKTLILSTSHSVFHFPLISTIDEITENLKSSIQNLNVYCGRQENDNNEMISTSHTIDLISSKSILSIDNFSSKQRSMMNQLANISITFSNDTICLAIGEANNIYHQNYERILVLNLNTNFDLVFINRKKIISKSSDSLLDKNILSNIHSLGFKDDENIIKIFARQLGKFLIPYITSFNPNLLLISGDIAQSWYLIERKLRRKLRKFSSMEIYFNLFNEKSICFGAIQKQLPKFLSEKSEILRHTDQYLLPVMKIKHINEYPTHEIPIGYIGIGHRELNEKFFCFIEEHPILLIDGFLGTNFDEFAEKFNEYYFQRKRKEKFSPLFFYDTKSFLRIEQEFNSLSSNNYSLKNDFDFKRNFIDMKKLDYLRNNLFYPCVIIGFGASFINETSPLIYIDLPKNEFYYRIENSSDFKIDCLSLTKLKHELLPRMNIFIDGQRPNCPTWINGDTFRQALAHISNQPIRTRPTTKLFRQNSLKTSNINGQLWETMTTDTGILLSDNNNHLIEFSWDIFYYSQANRILGNHIHYRLFHHINDFPISFNLFDTIKYEFSSTTNSQEYHKRNKAYYIIETKQSNTKEMNLSSTNHDFILVPNHRIHITSQNEIILEIFTKYNHYDYIQSIENEYRMKIEEFFLHTEQLRCRPVSIEMKINQYEEQQLPTPYFYIYDIYRLIISANQSIEICRKTHNRFHLCILVQGETIEMTFNSIDNKQDKQIRRYNYLETFLIPASIDQYYLRPIISTNIQNNKSQSYILLTTFLKTERN